uniref:Dynamin-type G domain-containing protein n=1 Tax=viral metagenome TaxID=1070528 RepID=A0A6C0EB65_9ZZZZ
MAEELFDIAREINSLCQYKNAITAPKIVTIGTQSSGKSSLINKLIGFDILPTKTGIATRCPIVFSVTPNESEKPVVKLSNGHQKELIYEGFIENINVIEEINKQTNKNVSDMNVTPIPIHIELKYKNAPTLSFIDLPGLIAIAKTDVGQSKTIIEDIKRIAKTYIQQKSTIVLTVVESKTDLETDIGLSFIKDLEDVDKKEFITVGVLTKPDLLKNGDVINNILDGKISSNISLDNGYFVVNNIDDSIGFYNSLKINNNNRCGSAQLGNYLTTLLTKMIKTDLINIKTQIGELHLQSVKELEELGAEELTDNMKIGLVSKILNDLQVRITESIESSGIEPNTGLKIKNVFNNYLKDLNSLDIFSSVGDKFYTDLLNSFSGYHMTNSIDINKILYKCINENALNPIHTLSLECMNEIIDVIEGMLEHFVKNAKYTHHENILKSLKKYYSNYIIDRKTEVDLEIKRFIKMESCFINTIDEKFVKLIHDFTPVGYVPINTIDSMMSRNLAINNILPESIHDKYIAMIKVICKCYYDTIKKNMFNNVTKSIMLNIIRNIEQNMNYMSVYEFITKDNLTLFQEDISIIERRKELRQLIEQLSNINAKIKKINTKVQINTKVF